jgi:fatty-acyl-CoA synthase
VDGHSDVASATLTPLRFLQRSEDVWADRPAVRDGDRLWSYAEHGGRVRRAAGALAGELGIGEGDRVAVLLPNVAAALELHYAVPGAGGVLVPLNTRLAADDYAYILGHAQPRAIVVHPSRREVLEDALARMDGERPRVIWDDGEYDDLLAAASPAALRHPADERALLSINYTSGTTGRPKGVMTTHRGAYLHALGVIAEAALTARSRYVWTLPMFH